MGRIYTPAAVDSPPPSVLWEFKCHFRPKKSDFQGQKLVKVKDDKMFTTKYKKIQYNNTNNTLLSFSNPKFVTLFMFTVLDK